MLQAVRRYLRNVPPEKFQLPLLLGTSLPKGFLHNTDSLCPVSYTHLDIVKDGLTLSTVMSMYILHEADENKFVEAANEILSRNKARRKTKLYEIRKARGFTQQQLSDASGVTLRMIQLYEQRQNDISKAQVNVVISLANALGCRVEDLLE